MNTHHRLQWQLLEYFATYTPDFVGGNDFTTRLDATTLQTNLGQLANHGLLENRFRHNVEGQLVWLCSRITGKGLILLQSGDADSLGDEPRHPSTRELLTPQVPEQLVLFAAQGATLCTSPVTR